VLIVVPVWDGQVAGTIEQDCFEVDGWGC